MGMVHQNPHLGLNFQISCGGNVAERLLMAGERRFAAWARRYLVRCPSRHPNLNQLGARFPRHVHTVERADAVAAGLARIELGPGGRG